MATVNERLAASGIPVPSGDLLGVPAELARIAEGVLRRRCRVLGLIPATDDVAVPAVALQIGHALACIAGGRAAVVDAQGTWLPDPTSGARDGPVFQASWLTPRLALLVPRALPAGATVRHLAACLRAETEQMSHVLIDLTGADHTGEHLEATELLDGVAVIARAARTTSRDLARWMREIPPAKNLGVVVVGAP